MVPVIWNREKGCEEKELVFGENTLRWLYESERGSVSRILLLRRRTASRMYGWYQSLPWSRRQISNFIKDYGIKKDEFEDRTYQSFNDYFARKFRPGVREFDQNPDHLPAFAEARYLAFDQLTRETRLPIKGMHLRPSFLLGDEELAKKFDGGSAFIARLAPMDYHRFHFPDDGEVIFEKRIEGVLDSVHPIALTKKPDIFVANEREVSILKTKNFGDFAYVEVGAICVGRIEQTYPKEEPFRRGQEKGTFYFGGSTVILLGEPGRWKPDEDLLNMTLRGMETFVKLGTRIATAAKGRT